MFEPQFPALSESLKDVISAFTFPILMVVVHANMKVNQCAMFCTFIFQMLKHPENIVSSDFKQHRLAAHDQHIIAEYEQLVTDWMGTIESILTDTSDERYNTLLYFIYN